MDHCSRAIAQLAGVASVISTQGEQVCNRQKIPFSTCRLTNRGTLRGLFDGSGPMIDHSKSVIS
jgi:hypothetical protein